MTSVFKKIEGASDISDLKLLLDKELVQTKMDITAYPKIEFSISRNDIEGLIEKGILSKDGHLMSNFDSDNKTSSLSRLLYSVLWKNGDLKKIHNIVKGVLSDNCEKQKSGVVFYQFGKFLRKEGQPIVDQHILRAFSIYQNFDVSRTSNIRNRAITQNSDWELIDCYKYWLKSNKLKKALRNCEDYIYYIDQVLFALGKSIKKLR